VLDLSATGSNPVLKIGSKLSLLADGTANYSGNLSAAGGTFSGNLSAAGGTFSGNLNAAGGTFKGLLTVDAVNAVNTINIAGNAVTTANYAAYNGFIRYLSGVISWAGSDTFATLYINADAGDILLIEATYTRPATARVYDSEYATWNYTVLANSTYLVINGVNVWDSAAVPGANLVQTIRRVYTATTTGTVAIGLVGYISWQNYNGTNSYAMQDITLSAFIRRR
jgi:hypothetical protein